MRILGLLQNSWARDPARVEAIMAKFGRRAMVTRLLMRSKSGRTLRKCLPDWYNRIEYENSSPRVLSYAGACGTVDIQHVRRVVAEQKPNVIMAFGGVAESAVKRLHWDCGPILVTQHPTARVSIDPLCEANDLLNVLERMWKDKPWS